MAYISKETPSGEIDGKNRIFEFLHEIQVLDDLWVDGAIYTNYNLEGKTIKLFDAPKKSIFGDYFTKTNISVISTEYISKEYPEGIIDGKNKIFYLKNEAELIDDLRIDGAIYTDYIFNGKNIKLNHAPKLSIFVDYMPKGSVVTVRTNITLGDIKDEIWRLLGQKPTSINFNNNVLVNKIDIVGRDIWRGRVVNILNPKETILAGNLAFQNSSKTFNIKIPGKLKEKIKFGDNLIRLNTYDLPSNGYLLVVGDIIKYTSKTDNELINITGLNSEHLINESVSVLYEIPKDFDKMIDLVLLENDREILIPYKEGKISYEILDFPKTQKKLLKVNGLRNNDKIKINYICAYPKMLVNEDFCPLPDHYGISVLASLVAGILAYENNLPMFSALFNIAYPNLRDMYSYYSEEIRINKIKLRPSPYNFKSLRF